MSVSEWSEAVGLGSIRVRAYDAQHRYRGIDAM